MSTQALTQHAHQLVQSIQQQQGQHTAILIANAVDRQQSASLFNSVQSEQQLVQLLRPILSALRSNFSVEILLRHLQSAYTQYRSESATAYSYAYQAAELAYTFVETEKDIIWALPIINKLCYQLRTAAATNDEQRQHQQTNGQSASVNGSDDRTSNTGPYKSLMQSQELLRRYLQRMIVDRSPIVQSKKLGCIAVINHLFAIYFSMNNLRLCTHLINMVKMLPQPIEQHYPQAHVVTYNYYFGRLMVFEENYSVAEKHLAYAFQHTHRDYIGNKRRILQFLIPVRLLRGKLPTQQLLQRYNLLQFTTLVNALQHGELAIFNEALDRYRETYIRKGTYLLLEKLKLLVYRNLCRKVSLIHSKKLLGAETVDNNPLLTTQPHQLPLVLLLSAVRVEGVDMPMDELECIVANLIYFGYMKGYIAHKRLVVLSKAQPFPPVECVTPPP